MATESPRDYLDRNGYKYKVSGKELLLDECPSCQRKHKCSINSLTWAWQCFVCEESGREYKLKQAFGDVYEHSGIDETPAINITAPRPETIHIIDKYQEDLFSDNRAMEYLQERGISRETARKCGLGWASDIAGRTVDTGTGWIVIPTFVKWTSDGWFDKKGLAMIKARSVPPAKKQYIRQKGGHTRLFQPHRINPKETVIVCAGEFDAMSFIECGYTNTVATTSGEGAWSDVFSQQLADAERVVIVYDNDRAGFEGAKKVSSKLGDYRCAIYRLPKQYKDANEAHVSGWLEDNVHKIVSTKIGIEQKVVRPSDLMHLVLSDDYASKGIPTGWKDLDKLIGGIRTSEMIVVTGETGTGKSTWTSNLALNIARQGTPILFMPLEIGAVRQAEKWAMQIGSKDPANMDETELQALSYEMDNLPLYILDQFGSVSPEALRNTVALCKEKLDVKVFFIDHVHFTAAKSPDYERLHLEQLIMACNEIAVDLNVAVVIVAHPNNRGAADGDGRIVQLGDLKGSSAIKQTAHLALSVWRDRSKERKQDRDEHGRTRSIVYCMKARSSRAQEGMAPLMFDKESQTYADVNSAMPVDHDEFEFNIEDGEF